MTCRLKLDILILTLTWMDFLPLIAHKRLVSVKLGLARANQVLKWSHVSYSKLEFQKISFSNPNALTLPATLKIWLDPST